MAWSCHCALVGGELARAVADRGGGGCPSQDGGACSGAPPAICDRKVVSAGETWVVGIKKVTVGTTAYCLPCGAARMDAVAAELGVSKPKPITLALG